MQPGERVAEPTKVVARFYRPGDEGGMLRVFEASFPRWPEVETGVPAIEHLRWKLQGSDAPERNHIVAKAGGEIIGARVSLTQHYRLRDHITFCRIDVDAAVLAEYRGQGVYSRMSEFGLERAKDASVVITSTGRPSLVELDRALGHRPVKNRMVSMVCDLSADAVGASTRAFVVRQAPAFDERTDAFWRLAAGPFDFIAAPSIDWLNWRYCDPRGGIGALLLAEDGCELLGFAAVRLSRGKGHIAYLLALPGRLEVVAALAAAALTRLRGGGASEVDCALPRQHPYRAVLEELGFEKGHRIPFTCRPNAPDVDLSIVHESTCGVHLMFGDTDLV